MRKTVAIWRPTLILLSIISAITFTTHPVEASPAIHIMTDGSIDPPTAPILTFDNVTYTLTGNISDSIVILRNNIVVDGAGYRIQGSGSPSSRGFDVSGRSNVTIRNAIVANFSHAFYISGTTSMILLGNHITANSPYGIYFEYASNSFVSANQIEDTDNGIYLLHSSSNRIDGNIIRNSYSAISLETISTNNTITGNVITNAGFRAVFLNSSTNNTVSGNGVTGSSSAISLSSSSNYNTVTGNNITDNGSGISLGTYSSFNIISGNIMIRSGFGVSAVSYSSFNTIAGNEVRDGNTCVSLSSYSSYNTISGNNLTGNGSNCVFLFLSANNTVSSNLIRNNGLVLNRSGVFIENSSNNTIYKNTIAGNWIGIFLWGNRSRIYDNDITDSATRGILLQGSSTNNTIYHNSLVNNPIQVDSGGAQPNSWDDNYPSGGNYWSDYAVVDTMSGPNQDVAGADGIGDAPYVIDSNNRDDYPLMSPPRESTPPVTTDDYDGSWHTSDLTITLSASDDISGVAATYYRINDGSVREASIDGQPLITFESPDNKLEYWSVDRAGNEESPHNMRAGIKLDKTPPSGSLSINGGIGHTNSGSVTLTVYAIDGASGISQMRFSSDGITWLPWEPYPSSYTTSRPWSLTGPDGEKRVYLEVMDLARLTSEYQDSIVLDTMEPTANAGSDRVVNEDSPMVLDASASTDENGVIGYTWTFTETTSTTLTGSNPTYTFSNPGTYLITLTVTDPAGNQATDTVSITVQPVQTTPPPGAPMGSPVLIALISAVAFAALATAIYLWNRRKTRNAA